MSNTDSTPISPIILALDTSSKLSSIAIARGERIVASFGAELDEKRSERLWAEIDFLLGEAGLGIDDVELYSVCVGPGGFTGLRVGIAAAKGFATATRKPVLGVTTLEALAHSAVPAAAVFSMVNAYRGEVYSQLFRFSEEGIPIAENDPEVSKPAEALKRVEPFDAVAFTGDGIAANLELIREIAGDRFVERALDGVFAAGRAEGRAAAWIIRRHPTFLAEEIARLGFLKFSRGEATDAEKLQACYVRPSEAQIRLSSAHGPSNREETAERPKPG